MLSMVIFVARRGGVAVAGLAAVTQAEDLEPDSSSTSRCRD
jgi:hypothetical protein